jgi:hypothetical protein
MVVVLMAAFEYGFFCCLGMFLSRHYLSRIDSHMFAAGGGGRSQVR